jgi:hypothetical protein
MVRPLRPGRSVDVNTVGVPCVHGFVPMVTAQTLLFIPMQFTKIYNPGEMSLSHLN